MTTVSSWRQRARKVIDGAHGTAIANGITDQAGIMQVVDAAYPFGPRECHPYKCWLQERREFRERQGWIKVAPKLTARQRELKAQDEADQRGNLL